MNIIGISGLENGVRFKKREFSHLSSRQLWIAQGFDFAARRLAQEQIIGWFQSQMKFGPLSEVKAHTIII